MLTPADKVAQASTLRLQFPVSSGTQHHAKENEWVPVEKSNPAITAGPVVPLGQPAATSSRSTPPSSAPATATGSGDTAVPPAAAAPKVPEDQKVFPDLADVVGHACPEVL